jgi:hypothetical protein
MAQIQPIQRPNSTPWFYLKKRKRKNEQNPPLESWFHATAFVYLPTTSRYFFASVWSPIPTAQSLCVSTRRTKTTACHVSTRVNVSSPDWSGSNANFFFLLTNAKVLMVNFIHTFRWRWATPRQSDAKKERFAFHK